MTAPADARAQAARADGGDDYLDALHDEARRYQEGDSGGAEGVEAKPAGEQPHAAPDEQGTAPALKPTGPAL